MIVLLGKNGLFGQHCSQLYPEIIALDKTECDITNRIDIATMLLRYRPSIVINAAGIVPKSSYFSNPYTVFLTNSFAVKTLAEECSKSQCTLIHLSTNEVFSGKNTSYEYSIPCPIDLYGLSKYLGESISYPHVIVRTSFVGFPDTKGHGLLSWLNLSSKVIGYDRVLWNGLTATELSRILFEKVIPDINAGVGNRLFHIHGESLTKYDMLCYAKKVYGWNIDIEKESEVSDTVHIANKTLSSIYQYKSTKPFIQQLMEMRELWGI